MSKSELRAAHPHEAPEVADTDARLLTQILIGAFAIMSIVPFVGYFLQS